MSPKDTQVASPLIHELHSCSGRGYGLLRIFRLVFQIPLYGCEVRDLLGIAAMLQRSAPSTSAKDSENGDVEGTDSRSVLLCLSLVPVLA